MQPHSQQTVVYRSTVGVSSKGTARSWCPLRLAIESLTLSMRNYGEGGGTPLQQSLVAMPVTGLLRMARVVERKALSLDRPSAERIEEIYDPVFLCGELARSQREVAARFLS